ncbi:MAG: HAD-IIIA family hydrolase [Betaproteobacteria bacterium]|nr:HAD-IIIA family hydrolase [Betaproteobacteria bacterium]
MDKQFELLVFDWDGTLVDSTEHIAASIQAAAKDMYLPIPSDEQARFIIGLGLADSMKYLFPATETARYCDIAARYSYHFLAGNHRIHPFPGTEEMLEGLHEAGYVIGIATGKSRRGLNRSLEESGLARFFHITRCADEGFPKPHPGMLLYLMDEVIAPPARTLMIGDTTHDMSMAHSAGARAVAVSYGAHEKEALLAARPLDCVDSIADLAKWLRNNG